VNRREPPAIQIRHLFMHVAICSPCRQGNSADACSLLNVPSKFLLQFALKRGLDGPGFPQWSSWPHSIEIHCHGTGDFTIEQTISALPLTRANPRRVFQAPWWP
jgi:hypothetical protein